MDLEVENSIAFVVLGFTNLVVCDPHSPCGLLRGKVLIPNGADGGGSHFFPQIIEDCQRVKRQLKSLVLLDDLLECIVF